MVENEYGSDNYSSFVEIVGNTLCDYTIIQYCVYMIQVTISREPAQFIATLSKLFIFGIK